jgi:hypothetical protein
MATKDRAAQTWTEVEARNRTIDAGVPKHGAGHLERSNKMDAQVQKAQEQRRAAFAKEKPVQPATGTLPALTNAPKAATFPAFKKG